MSTPTRELGRPRDPELDERILDAARRLLDEAGAEAVTLAAVARASGVSRPTLYRRYPDADGLLADLLARDLAAVLAQAPAPEGKDPVARVMARFDPLLEHYAAHPERSRALLRAATLAPGGPDTPLNQLNQARIAELGALIAGLPAPPPGGDPHLLGFIVYACNLALLLAGMHGVLPDPRQRREALAACVAWTLRTEPP